MGVRVIESVDQSSCKRQLKKYLPVMATAWYQAIVLTDCDTDQTLTLHAQVVALAEQTVNLLCQPPFDNDAAQQIGITLASLDCVQPEVLSRSQAVLSRQLLNELPVNVSPATLAQLLGNMSIGYFSQVQNQPNGYSEPDRSIKTVDRTARQLDKLKQMQILDLAAINQQLRQEIAKQREVESELRQYNRDLAVVNRASQVFYSTLDLDQVLSTILEELHSILDVYAFSLWLIDEETRQLVCYRTTESHSEVMLGWRLDMGQGVAGRVAETGKTIIVNETRADSYHFKGIDKQLGIEIRSILSVPLLGRDGVIGVIQVVDTVPNRFAATHQLLLESLAEAAGVAIENAGLFEQSRRDVESKSILLREINHRVKNNLAVIKSLLHLKRSRITAEDFASIQSITEDVLSQVQGLATVHNLLSTSNWTPLPLGELAGRVIDAALQVLSPDKLVSVSVEPSPVWVSANQAHDLALVINELLTNSVKYALPYADGVLKIKVNIGLNKNLARLEFKDNGPGYPEELLLLRPEHHSLGFELIKHIVHNSLQGEISVRNEGGAVALIDFPVEAVDDNL